MKKSLIAGFILLVVGLIMTAFGVGHGGLRGVYWDDRVRVDERIDKTQSIKGIQSIVLDSSNYNDVSIKRGSKAQVKVMASKSRPIDTTFKNHELTVHSEKDSVMIGSAIGPSDPAVQITIPENVTLKRVTNQGNSAISIDGVNVDEINGDNGSGDLSLNNVTVKKPLDLTTDGYFSIDLNQVTAPSLNFSGSMDVDVKRSTFNRSASSIKTTYGDIELEDNHWQQLSVKGGSGDLEFENERFTKGLTASLDSGDIEGQIAKSADTVIRTRDEDGDVHVYADGARNYGRSGKDKVIYRLKSDSGDITIKE